MFCKYAPLIIYFDKTLKNFKIDTQEFQFVNEVSICDLEGSVIVRALN